MTKEEIGETVNVAAWCRGCGGLVFVACDEPDMRKDNARELAKAFRRGFRVGEILTKDVWTGPPMGCRCKPAEKEKP